MNQPIQIEDFSLEQCGYVRRSDMDSPGKRVWETPSGSLIAYPVGIQPRIARFNSQSIAVALMDNEGNAP